MRYTVILLCNTMMSPNIPSSNTYKRCCISVGLHATLVDYLWIKMYAVYALSSAVTQLGQKLFSEVKPSFY